jgi:hypothetical protein
MRVAIHQPDLLPWSGFWFKMVNTDKFVLAVHDQLQKHWVQRRVMMRDTWVTLPLVGKPHLVPINTVEVKDGWQQHLADSIRGRYVGAKHWKSRGEDLVDRITSVEGSNLAEINIALIDMVRELLGITTELVIPDPPVNAGLDRVLEVLQAVGATSYLSGTGARDYIRNDGEAKFRALGIDLVWSDHLKVTGDSVVTLFMDHDEPMDVIHQRHGQDS